MTLTLKTNISKTIASKKLFSARIIATFTFLLISCSNVIAAEEISTTIQATQNSIVNAEHAFDGENAKFDSLLLLMAISSSVDMYEDNYRDSYQDNDSDANKQIVSMAAELDMSDNEQALDYGDLDDDDSYHISPEEYLQMSMQADELNLATDDRS